MTGEAVAQMVETEIMLNDRAAVVRLMRPRSLNALSGPLLDELDSALDRLAALPELRVIVLTGSETCFSVGADLKEPIADIGQRVARMHRLVERLAEYPAISIAAIEGWALGGGLELAMACTFRAAAPGAKLGLPEIRLGVIPSYGGTQLTPRLLGSARALELLCFGEPVDAVQAEKIGLINWIADEAGAVALALDQAALLADRSMLALAGARQAVREGQSLPLRGALAVEAAVSANLVANSPVNAAHAFRSRTPTSR